MTADPNSPDGPLRDEDLRLLESLRQGGEWLRSVLCTLARRGQAMRSAEPERARALLEALSVYPWYKGGQFLFDLMEWEDFMVDGSPPPAVATVLDAAALSQIASTLDLVKSNLDSAAVPAGAPIEVTGRFVDDDALPPLKPDMYLYADVVLGVLASVLPAFLPRVPPV